MQKKALRGQTGNHSKVAEGGELKEGRDSYRTSLSRANWQTKQIGGAQLKEVEGGSVLIANSLRCKTERTVQKLQQIQTPKHFPTIFAHPCYLSNFNAKETERFC